jgi:hypothetical protein
LYPVVEAVVLYEPRKERKMSDDMIFDEGMVCTPDDPNPFGADETGIWELPEYGEGIGPGPDETGIWELPDDLQESPSVEIDWDQIEPGEGVVDPPTCPGFEIEEPTVSDAPQSPALLEEHPAAPGDGAFDYGPEPEAPSLEELGLKVEPELPTGGIDELPTGDYELSEFEFEVPDFFIP